MPPKTTHRPKPPLPENGREKKPGEPHVINTIVDSRAADVVALLGCVPIKPSAGSHSGAKCSTASGDVIANHGEENITMREGGGRGERV